MTLSCFVLVQTRPSTRFYSYCVYLSSNSSIPLTNTFTYHQNLNKSTLHSNYHLANCMLTIKIAIANSTTFISFSLYLHCVNNIKVTISCIHVIKYSLHLEPTTSDLFTHVKLNQYCRHIYIFPSNR
jgi:hypothetical protein